MYILETCMRRVVLALLVALSVGISIAANGGYCYCSKQFRIQQQRPMQIGKESLQASVEATNMKTMREVSI
jgi:hypothetical protein